MSDTAVADNPVATEAAKPARKKSNISPEAKQALALRRDAALLERLAPTTLEPSVLTEKAKLMRQQADKLAPQAPKQPARPLCASIDASGKQCGSKAQKDSQYCFSHTDNLQKLTAAEWDAVSAHFLGGSTEQFQRTLLEGFSWKQLKQIASQHTTSAA